MVEDSESNTIYVAAITEVEITSAVARLRRESAISDQLASDVLDLLRHHLDTGAYVTVVQSGAVLARTRTLLFRHPLRAMDAIQLASAIEISLRLRAIQLESPIVITADRRLAAAAELEGLGVIDPAG